MQKVNFPYRSSMHLPFLHVVAESGAWEKHGLEVNYNFSISAKEAHRAVAQGSIEFVGGNHVSTYAKRPHGDKWVYLAQCVNTLNHRLVVRPDSGIARIADLKGKTFGTQGNHPSLNDWLFLKQRGLDEERGDITFKRRAKDKDAVAIEMIRSGKVDAFFLVPPGDLFARRAGLKVIDIDFMPMIWFTTISSGLPFVETHPEIVERFLKGVIEGIAYFKRRRPESIKIIQAKYKEEGELDDEAAAYLYDELANILEPKPYPSLDAIRNVYVEAQRQDPDARKVNPMELWDLHHLRCIDDSGFIDALYRTETHPQQQVAGNAAQRGPL